MNNKVIEWTDLALNDLDSIYTFILKDSSKNANLVVRELLNNVDEIYLFPKRGRKIPQIGKDYYREILVGTYRIMYKIDGDSIYIMGIIHMAIDFTFEKLKKR